MTPHAPPERIVVTGAAGTLGRRVVARLHRSRPRVEVVAIDRDSMSWRSASVTTRRVDMESGDLPEMFSDADAVVHLASTVKADSSDIAEAERELALFSRMLDALTQAGVTHLVVMSSAMVYGARAGNPVPLTEDAPERPNADFDWAAQRFRLEQLARRWAADGLSDSERTVAVLRPTAVVSEGRLGHLAQTLRSARAGVMADGDPPVQYLHVDDLASAVVAVLRTRYDGTANVAPDGWIPPDGLADLEGHRPQTAGAHTGGQGRERSVLAVGFGAHAPGVVPYTVHPWVIANDRLRSLGWAPAYSNEEAWVVSHEPRPWESLPSGRRQELLLALTAAALFGAVAVVVWAAARAHQRRRR